MNMVKPLPRTRAVLGKHIQFSNVSARALSLRGHAS